MPLTRREVAGNRPFFTPAGRRYAPLVVNQTTARSMPGQQTRGQDQTRVDPIGAFDKLSS